MKRHYSKQTKRLNSLKEKKSGSQDLKDETNVSFNMKKRDFELIQTLTNTKTPASKSPRDNSLGNSTQEAKSIESDEREMINVINYTDKMPNLDLIQIRQASAASKSSKERVLTEANTILREGSKT